MKTLNTGAAISLALLTVPALAQEAMQLAAIPRVEITGSAIKRIAQSL